MTPIKEAAVLTLIDFRKQLSDVANLETLPKQIQEEIKSVESISSYGFQTLNGHNGRQCIWSAGGYWDGKRSCEQDGLYGRGYGKQKFFITSYGSDKWQWNGETLRTTSKIIKS